MTRLTGPDFYCWLALRRVRRGGVARFDGRYYDSGRPVPGYLVPDVLAALLEQELTQLADPDSAGMRRVALTVAGQARYAALEHQQRAGLQVPAPEFGTMTPPGGQPDPPGTPL